MNIIDFIVNIDMHLSNFCVEYGIAVYGIIFGIIFLETGVIIAPFLPGDSLLFAAGALSAGKGLDIRVLLIIIPLASILGDMVNFFFGKWIGPKIFKKNAKILKTEYLNKAHEFYEKYGNWAIVLCRFFPILRTFTPFVAGIAKMNYYKFMLYNIIGGFLWGVSLLMLGYLLGNIPFVKENFEYMVFGIIGFSLIPMTITVLTAYKNRAKIIKKD